MSAQTWTLRFNLNSGLLCQEGFPEISQLCFKKGWSNIDVWQYLAVKTPVLTIIGGVKTTDVADAANPLVHLFFGVSHQVEDAVDGLDVEYEAVLQVLLIERQPGVHLREATNMSYFNMASVNKNLLLIAASQRETWWHER